jgi:hypothetical protein
MGDSAGDSITNAKRLYGDGEVPADADLNAPHAAKGDPGPDDSDDAVEDVADALPESASAAKPDSAAPLA